MAALRAERLRRRRPDVIACCARTLAAGAGREPLVHCPIACERCRKGRLAARFQMLNVRPVRVGVGGGEALWVLGKDSTPARTDAVKERTCALGEQLCNRVREASGSFGLSAIEHTTPFIIPGRDGA